MDPATTCLFLSEYGAFLVDLPLEEAPERIALKNVRSIDRTGTQHTVYLPVTYARQSQRAYLATYELDTSFNAQQARAWRII